MTAPMDPPKPALASASMPSPAPAPTAPTVPSRRRRRGLLAALAGLLVLALSVAGVLFALWWAAFSEPGTGWLLSQVPGLVISQPSLPGANSSTTMPVSNSRR